MQVLELLLWLNALKPWWPWAAFLEALTHTHGQSLCLNSAFSPYCAWADGRAPAWPCLCPALLGVGSTWFYIWPLGLMSWHWPDPHMSNCLVWPWTCVSILGFPAGLGCWLSLPCSLAWLLAVVGKSPALLAVLVCNCSLACGEPPAPAVPWQLLHDWDRIDSVGITNFSFIYSFKVLRWQRQIY